MESLNTTEVRAAFERGVSVLHAHRAVMETQRAETLYNRIADVLIALTGVLVVFVFVMRMWCWRVRPAELKGGLHSSPRASSASRCAATAAGFVTAGALVGVMSVGGPLVPPQPLTLAIIGSGVLVPLLANWKLTARGKGSLDQ